ncbi:hypothetical protein DFH07DRAFT_444313 [Mycena maculata]|uniref:Uncharacterized protein n=1 Tax=Mycena maculata TaxID=230809 RepID=A0AAD7JA09_9AGAR|nr:hypothetical protein DFH07DRAFT_444313 [Mycena maculata]
MTIDIPASDPHPGYDSDLHNKTEHKEQGASGPEPRYIYYRVYLPDGAIPSRSAFDSSNPFVGRIAARSVPPPHNAGSLKRCLVKMEDLPDPAGLKTALFLNPAAPAPMSDSDQVSLRGPGALSGSTPENALALAFTEDLTAEERIAMKTAMDAIGIAGIGGHNPVYLYYHLFTPFEEDTSRVSFNPHEPALGRVEKIHISPPHSPTTIKQHIAKVEGKSIYAYVAQLFRDISANTTMNGYISLLRVGLTADKPLVLVQPQRRAGLYNIPVKVLSRNMSRDPFTEGTIVFTDGVQHGFYHYYQCANVPGNIADGDLPPGTQNFAESPFNLNPL